MKIGLWWARLFIKKKAQPALLETETDEEDTLFMFNNPNILKEGVAATKA